MVANIVRDTSIDGFPASQKTTRIASNLTFDCQQLLSQFYIHGWRTVVFPLHNIKLGLIFTMSTIIPQYNQKIGENHQKTRRVHLFGPLVKQQVVCCLACSGKSWSGYRTVFLWTSQESLTLGLFCRTKNLRNKESANNEPHFEQYMF